MRRRIVVLAAFLLSVGHVAWGATLYPVTDLGTLPGGSNSCAYGINSYGRVVGQTNSSSGSNDAFLYAGGTMTDLRTLLPANSASEAISINASGQVALDAYLVSDGHQHAFLYGGGKMTDLGMPQGCTSSYVSAINSSGQIVGVSYSGGDSHSFLYTGGGMTDLGVFHGVPIQMSEACGINDQGQVAGYSYSLDGNLHAYLWDGTHGMTDLGAPAGFNTSAGISSWAYGINNKGQVVGEIYSNAIGADDVFLYSGGQMVDLGKIPQGSMSAATAINNQGVVVGYGKVSGVEHAFLYRNGTMSDLNSLIVKNSGWTLEKAEAINDSGQVVGYGYHNGHFAAFLVNTPEPSTFVLLGIGAASMFAYRLWRRRKAA